MQPEFSLFVIMSRKCNLACSYCFQNGKGIKDGSDVHQEHLDKLLSYLKKNPFIKHITLFGGEPLAEKEATLRILETIQEIHDTQHRTILVAIITNGTIYIPELKQYQKFISNIQFSIDGGKENHDSHRKYKDGTGSFDTAVATMQKYFEDEFKISIHGVVDPDTIDSFIAGFGQLDAVIPDGKVVTSFEFVHHQNYSFTYIWKQVRKLYKYLCQIKQDGDHQHIFFTRGYSFTYNTPLCTMGTNFLSFDVKTGKFYVCHEVIEDPAYEVGSIDAPNDQYISAERLNLFKDIHDIRKAKLGHLPHWLSQLIIFALHIQMCQIENKRLTGDFLTGPLKLIPMAYYGRKFYKKFEKDYLWSYKDPRFKDLELKEEAVDGAQ